MKCRFIDTICGTQVCTRVRVSGLVSVDFNFGTFRTLRFPFVLCVSVRLCKSERKKLCVRAPLFTEGVTTIIIQDLLSSFGQRKKLWKIV